MENNLLMGPEAYTEVLQGLVAKYMRFAMQHDLNDSTELICKKRNNMINGNPGSLLMILKNNFVPIWDKTR